MRGGRISDMERLEPFASDRQSPPVGVTPDGGCEHPSFVFDDPTPPLPTVPPGPPLPGPTEPPLAPLADDGTPPADDIKLPPLPVPSSTSKYGSLQNKERKNKME
uniref:Uncharacterized protein n=1 Tax=Octopus bimaculoides TaxID=37653 RepID=A0A0L8FQ88_OCTBM